jgi:hypothetical protein
MGLHCCTKSNPGGMCWTWIQWFCVIFGPENITPSLPNDLPSGVTKSTFLTFFRGLCSWVHNIHWGPPTGPIVHWVHRNSMRVHHKSATGWKVVPDEMAVTRFYKWVWINTLIPFLGGWTSIYQLFWCSPGVQGFDTLPNQCPLVK